MSAQNTPSPQLLASGRENLSCQNIDSAGMKLLLSGSRAQFDELSSIAQAPEKASASWSRLCVLIPELRSMDQCPQDQRHHAEGDVGIHTRLCLDALESQPEWAAFAPDAKTRLFLAVLLHDCAKPSGTFRELDGSISSRGHSMTGANLARLILWRMQAPISERESICRIIRWHQIPFFAAQKNETRRIQELSLDVSLPELSFCARVDAIGRDTNPKNSKEETLYSIEAFDEMCRKENVWDGPKPCAGPFEKRQWLLKPDGSIDPAWPLHETERPKAILLSGLPGSGKSHFSRALGLPVIGFDLARAELGLTHGDDEGQVARSAREKAKELLRTKSSFIFDATALLPDLRQKILNVFEDYNAQTAIVCVERSPKELFDVNRNRGSAKIPEKALLSMISRWSAPLHSEAGAVFFQNLSGKASFSFEQPFEKSATSEQALARAGFLSPKNSPKP